MTDAALQWFLDDAKAQGLSVREYERTYGIILLPAEHEIRAHEVPMSAMSESGAGRYSAVAASEPSGSAGSEEDFALAS